MAGPAEIRPLRGLTGPHQSSREQSILSLGCSPLSTSPAPARPFPLGPALKILLMVEAQLRLPNRNQAQPCALLGKTARSLKQLLEQSEVLTPISQVTKLRPRVYPDAQGHLIEVGFEPRTVHITLFPCAGSLQMAGFTPARLGLSEGRVQVPATGTPQYKRSAPTPLAVPQPQPHEERPLGHTPGSGCVTLSASPAAPGLTHAPVPVPPAAHVPRTPDAGAAGSPSGGGLFPRSPSRVAPPAPEAASAMARTGQVRGCRTPGRRGAAGSWGPEWHHRARGRRQRPLSPARTARRPCASLDCRPRPSQTSILLP